VQSSAPRFRIRLRVVDGDLHGHVPNVAAPEAFDGMQSIGMGMAIVIQPAFIVEAARLDDQRIALPSANRVTEPRGLRIFGKQAAIRKDLPKLYKFLEENQGHSGSADHLER
jgi:hypothetical protein